MGLWSTIKGWFNIGGVTVKLKDVNPLVPKSGNTITGKVLLTTKGWETQGLTDTQGHAYRGLAWYRQAVDLPKELPGKSVWLCAPAVVNEAWVWVNGQYTGHRLHSMPWSRPQTVELEITPLVHPGQRNQITFRVLNNVDVFGASGIYERMFLYTKP